ncbi:hypothetical protein EDC01DRAFT_627141 [Geopyxis carbonaria]|nr:hypothetical protein EDC01DRAFT_627141 [Geopyxis carbonaria]
MGWSKFPTRNPSLTQTAKSTTMDDPPTPPQSVKPNLNADANAKANPNGSLGRPTLKTRISSYFRLPGTSGAESNPSETMRTISFSSSSPPRSSKPSVTSSTDSDSTIRPPTITAQVLAQAVPDGSYCQRLRIDAKIHELGDVPSMPLTHTYNPRRPGVWGINGKTRYWSIPRDGKPANMMGGSLPKEEKADDKGKKGFGS